MEPVSVVEAELAELGPERRPVEAEKLRGGGAVAACMGQSLAEQRGLHEPDCAVVEVGFRQPAEGGSRHGGPFLHCLIDAPPRGLESSPVPP